MRDRTSLNTLCIENPRAFSSVFIKRTRKLNLNSSKGIIHLKFNPYMSLSTDTTEVNIKLTLLKFYVRIAFVNFTIVVGWKLELNLTKQNSYFNLDTKLQKWWIRGDKRV